MPQDTITEQKRTERQNRAIHTYLELVARELSNQGQTLQGIVKKVAWAEITPTKQAIKEILWKPIQEATLGKKSTTELTTSEVNKVYEVMSMFLSKEFGISLPFPQDNHLESYEESIKT